MFTEVVSDCEILLNLSVKILHVNLIYFLAVLSNLCYDVFEKSKQNS